MMASIDSQPNTILLGDTSVYTVRASECSSAAINCSKDLPVYSPRMLPEEEICWQEIFLKQNIPYQRILEGFLKS